jgi:hypothetical protein
MANLTVVDWLTPETLVLALGGALDSHACHYLSERLALLLGEWPGISITLDLQGIRLVAVTEAEDLFLQIVARRASGGKLALARPSAACLPLLRRLNIDYVLQLPGETPRRHLVGGRA